MPRIIAYFMREEQREAARSKMTSIEVTDSYIVGDIAEQDIAALRAKGLVIETIEDRPPIETPGTAWVVMPGVHRPGREDAAPRGPGAAPPAIDLSKPNFYLIQLRGPLLEPWRARLAAAGCPVERESAFTLYVRDPDGALVALSHHPA